MTIELTHEQAVVLSDLIYRISEKEEYFEDNAEQCVLWIIEAQLDKQLTEPFRKDYCEIVKACRDHVRNHYPNG